MSENLIMNVPQDFNLDSFVAQLASDYQSEGYNVNVVNLYGTKKIQIKKDCSGFKNFMGLSQEISANCSVSNGALTITYSDASWTFKIIALVIGLFLGLCAIGIPFLICSIMGIVKQISLPKKISEKSTVIIGNLSKYPTY